MTNQPRPAPTRPVPLTWHKSSYSGNTGGQCVEIAVTTTGSTPACLVRDSKDGTGPYLAFGAAAWRAFTTAIKTGTISRAGNSQ